MKVFTFRLKCQRFFWSILFLGAFAHIHAQGVEDYVFLQTQETYTPLTNPTQVAVATANSGAGQLRSNVYTLTDVIPFQFPFNGSNYTSLNVYVNGYATFGSVATNTTSPISATTGYDGVISPMGGDLVSLYNTNGLTSNINYEVLGTAPNRKFVVEWNHFQPYTSFPSATSYYDFNFQMVLHENGNIRMIYDLNYLGSVSSKTVQVGLRGANRSDYNNRTASGNATSNWTSTTAGTSFYNTIGTNRNTLPGSGLTFNYTPQANSLSTNEIIENDHTITMYPNPTSSILNIESKKPVKAYEIFSGGGKLVMKGSEERLIVSHLASGMYFIRIVYKDNTSESHKFIKN